MKISYQVSSDSVSAPLLSKSPGTERSPQITESQPQSASDGIQVSDLASRMQSVTSSDHMSRLGEISTSLRQGSFQINPEYISKAVVSEGLVLSSHANA